ncbi:hypothetical protein CHCC20347_1898 [Bacillus paralicheniformis]|nr:hypothetical protein CHCC20347_1898 [Bacillus paralicheniformis]
MDRFLEQIAYFKKNVCFSKSGKHTFFCGLSAGHFHICRLPLI